MLISTGISPPSTFSNSSAGPPSAITRLAISVISSSLLTGALTRRNSPLRSRNAANSRKSL